MPDLATHVLVPLSGIRLIEIARGRILMTVHMRYIFALGCILPDVIDKGIPYTYDYLHRFFAGSKSPFFVLEFLHSSMALILSI